jgi:hypothetical protein
MLAWLTQQSSGGENGVSRHKEREGSPNDGKDVIYASKNKKKGISFVCSAPVGSKHAADAMDICGQIYSGTSSQGQPQQQQRALKDRHRLEEQSRQEKASGLPSADPRRHQPESSPRKRHWGFGGGSTSTFDEDDDSASTFAPSEVSSVSSVSTLTSASRHARQAEVDRPKGRYSARGFRHDDGSKTTYFVEKEGRTMFVSAPKGTTEAAVFDAIAQKGVANGTTKIEGSKGQSRHRFVDRD